MTYKIGKAHRRVLEAIRPYAEKRHAIDFNLMAGQLGLASAVLKKYLGALRDAQLISRPNPHRANLFAVRHRPPVKRLKLRKRVNVNPAPSFIPRPSKQQLMGRR